MVPNQLTPRQVVADLRAAALSSGRYDLMTTEYAYPLTVYIDGEPLLLQGPADSWAFYQTFHSAMRADGFDRMTAKVTAEDIPRGGRFRVWTEWFGEGQAHARTRIAATICYCSVVSYGVLTEMIEFTAVSLPLLTT